MTEWWQTLLIAIATLIVGGIIGFFLARFYFQKQIEKNPPINEDMIRALYSQTGRKPSEAQVRAIMNSVNKAKNKKK